MNYKLRKFLYLDKEFINDSLGAILGEEYETTIVEKISNKIGAGVNAGMDVLKGNGEIGREKNIETTNKAIVTDPMKFQQLYDEVESYQDGKIYYDYITSDIWENFERDDIIEIVVNLELPKLINLASTISTFKNINNVFKANIGQGFINKSDMKKVDSITELAENEKTEKIPCLMKFINDKKYSIVGYIEKDNLTVDMNKLQGEVTVLCKIKRRLAENEKLSLSNLENTIKSIPQNREQRRKNKITIPKEISDTVKSPAIIVIPIAIYL